MSNSPELEAGTERSLRSNTRNPRRRPRQSDTESLKVAPRRKRSKISEDTFIPPRHDEEGEEQQEHHQVNGGAAEAANMNGDVQPASSGRGRGRPRKASVPTLDLEIPVRSKRTSVKRPTRGDGATVLTQNSRYAVKLLPSTPKELRKDGIEWRGSIGSAHLALAVTRSKAYIWDYTAHSPVTNARVFEVPFPSKAGDALPFGALVSTGSSTETGLILISANTGKVVFYESVERAASLGLFQERNAGIEGSLGSLFSGEVVTDVVSAHHAGFIVVLSSGRIAQLTLRDGQGKARISAQFLRATDQNSTGLFGSIKGFLGAGGWRRDVAAVHTRPLGPRGQMQVISLTEKAELQTWDLDWSGQYTFKGTLDFREVLTQELRKLEQPELQGKCEFVTALDLAVLERPALPTQEIVPIGKGLALDLFVLLQVGRANDCEYFAAGILIDGGDVAVPQLLQLTTCQRQKTGSSTNKPRLLLPKPAHTALAIFEDVIVVKQIDQSDANSPEAQLHASYVQPATFEDSICLRQDGTVKTMGAIEENSKGADESAIAFINGAGLVRVTVTSPPDAGREDTIPIKSKIEQAIFHGALQDGNIIDFSRTSHSIFLPDEIESAALEISSEILRSTSPYISTNPTSIETHLAYKAHALRALVNHVQQSYPSLTRSAMWQLLWDAERVAAAQQLWVVFENHVAAHDQTKRIATVMNDVCLVAIERLDSLPEGSVVNDAVRTFLIHKLQHLDLLLTMANTLLSDVYADAKYTPQDKFRVVGEADDLWNQALETVFAFRMNNAAAYGILPQLIENGILVDQAEYTDLPEFWTSSVNMLKASVRMAEQSRAIVSSEFEKVPIEAQARLEPMIKDINAHNPRLLESMCSIYQERINWLASRSDEKHRELAEQLRATYKITRYNNFREQADIALSEEGMKLAEKYRDMDTLTEMIVAEMQFSIDSLGNTPEKEQASILQYIAKITAKVSTYFARYGEQWANAYFNAGFSSSQGGVMLRDAQEHWQAALTKYLRAQPDRAKICWVNDITADRDFAHASESLFTAAQDPLTKTWEKKVELSMGKLALLAAEEDLEAQGKPAEEARINAKIAMPEHELEVVTIQERLLRHMLPEIKHCIDRQAEVEVAMQKFAHKNQDLHALKKLLETNLDRLFTQIVLPGEELIDILTLLDNVETDDMEEKHLEGAEFFLALKVLNAIAPETPQSHVDNMLQLIWKRCYVYDNWFDLDAGQKQHLDGHMDDRLRSTAAWRTLLLAAEANYFDTPGRAVRMLMPSECVGAGCRAEDLSYRWANEDILDPIVKDNRIQDEQLQAYIDDRRLDAWIEMCVDGVKKAVVDRVEDRALRMQKERDFEERVLHRSEMNGAKVNGHLLVPDGLDGDNSAVFVEDGHGDEDGDVEMG